MEVAEWSHAQQLPAIELPARYNIAPTQDSYIVVDELGVRSVEVARWGLIPSWSSDPGHAARMINARSETVAQKPAYRAAFRKRRCLVPVDGYYEWQASSGKSGGAELRPHKQPFYIRPVTDEPLGLAGLFEDWEGPDGLVRTFTILTQDARSPLDRVHDRMPVVVDPRHWEMWLDPHTPADEVLLLLADLMAEPLVPLEAYPVSTAVNKSMNDGPQMREPVGPLLDVG